MSSVNRSEYRQLEIDSSNLLFEADRCRVLGRYELSAYAMFNAGRVRLRMGQIVFSDNEVQFAAEDWLSSADCFLHASDDKRAEVPLDIVRKLRDEHRLPPDRKDLLESIQERERGLSVLREQVRNFLRGLATTGFRLESPNQESLTSLLRQVPNLPGYPQLHYLIYRLASSLDARDLAAFHIHWAATFEPSNPNYVALLGYEFIKLGKPESALSVGRDFLISNAGETGQVRIMIANALAATTGNRPPDREGAIKALLPIIGDKKTPIRQQVAAMALCAVFQYELGQVRESNRLLDEITDIAYMTRDDETLKVVDKFRQIVPHVEDMETAQFQVKTIPEEDRRLALAAASDLALAS